MSTGPRFRTLDSLCLLAVLLIAGGTRSWFLIECAEDARKTPAVLVQGTGVAPRQATDSAKDSAFDALVDSLLKDRKFVGPAPLSDADEATAHVAPVYPWLVAQARRLPEDPLCVMRWLHMGLGTLTAGCLFFFARRAFSSGRVGALAGLLYALSPMAIINTAEIADGSVVTFLLAFALMLGARAHQQGGAVTSLLFGLCLAALPMVRPTFLPFALIAFVGFLWRSRDAKVGWFAGLLCFLGFANGLAPWALRNFQLFDEPAPIVSSVYLHLWIGNNPMATGGSFDEKTLRESLPADRLRTLLDEPNQARRYAKLARDVGEQMRDHPRQTVTLRIKAGLAFLLGERWWHDQRLGLDNDGADVAPLPEWLADRLELILQASWLALFLLGLLGWRWSHAWRKQARLGTLAMIFVPLPYLLGHAEYLSGPRLPWDALLCCYAAYALAYFTPNFVYEPQTEE